MSNEGFNQDESQIYPEKKEDENANLTEIFNGLITDAPLISSVDRSKAPFRDYHENNIQQWKYVKADEVFSYLDSKFFFDTGRISSMDLCKAFSIYAQSEDQCIKVPLDLVVNAKGFENWRGRDPEKYTKNWYSIYGSGDSKSLDVIKHYAGLHTKLPPVTQMLMFIQPDGKVFFDNCSGDSHRMAAAILRGFEFIETSQVDAYTLNRNYL